MGYGFFASGGAAGISGLHHGIGRKIAAVCRTTASGAASGACLADCMAAQKRAEYFGKKREKTNDNIYRYINDLAGIRVVCLYLDDVDRVRVFLEKLPGIRVLKIKDFIKKPKNSGYQSLHMQVQFPNMRKVEIQIRTMGMDYWSVMEHELQYKKKSKIGRSLHKELLACASDMRRMDERMQNMRRLLDKQHRENTE